MNEREEQVITKEDVGTLDVADLGLADLDVINPEAVVDPAPVTEDELEKADSAPDPAPTDVGRTHKDAHKTSRQIRKARQRGR